MDDDRWEGWLGGKEKSSHYHRGLVDWTYSKKVNTESAFKMKPLDPTPSLLQKPQPTNPLGSLPFSGDRSAPTRTTCYLLSRRRRPPRTSTAKGAAEAARRRRRGCATCTRTWRSCSGATPPLTAVCPCRPACAGSNRVCWGAPEWLEPGG